MNVLSLCDGISCLRIALQRGGHKVDKYFASEIKKSAIKCSKDNWNDIIQESLSSFCSPHFLSNDVKVTDKMMITALIAEPSYWGQIHRNSKYKYRELLKQEVVNDELTLAMKETFEKSSEDLKRELDTWLQGLDVTEIVD